MDSQLQKIDNSLDDDQRKILFLLSLYSSEEELVFLQYTGWLVISFYIMTKGLLPNYKEQLLVYDYKCDRRYLWEDKKYMDDVNVLRRAGLVIRARSRSQEYRDINAHQCSKLGHEYLQAINFKESPMGQAILNELSCKKCGRCKLIILSDEQPILKCPKCKRQEIVVEGFLKDLYQPIEEKVEPYFL